MIEIWRLVRQSYCSSPRAAFDGTGAAIAGGRWNRKGTRVVYASSARSLAVLELLATIERRDAPDDYAFVRAQLDDCDVTSLASLPPDWRSPARSAGTVDIGEDFVRTAATLALAVPSVLIPQEANYVINPMHPRFSRLETSDAFEPFAFDERLFSFV